MSSEISDTHVTEHTPFLRSILKTPTYRPDDTSIEGPPARASSPLRANAGSTPRARVTDAHRQTAIHHAQQLELQKTHSLEILLRVETLLELPTTQPGASSSRPLDSDAALFLRLISAFQPSEYDALVAERNINSSCGYVLCARPPRRDSKGARLRIVGGGRRKDDFRVVEAKEMEKWCSVDCARSGLWVRLQLNEVPGWMRDGLEGEQVELLKEGAQNDAHKAVHNLADLTQEMRLGPDDRACELAVERGEMHLPGLAPVRTTLVEIEVHEKVFLAEPTPPSLDSGVDQRLGGIEGYKPKFAAGRSHDVSVDEDGTDWALETLSR